MNEFYILNLTLQDSDISNAKLLVYLNGILDTILNLKQSNLTQIFVHFSDLLMLELQQNNKSYGERKYKLADLIQSSEPLKWLHFDSAMVLIKLSFQKIGQLNQSQQQSIQHTSVTENKKQNLLDVNDFINSVILKTNSFYIKIVVLIKKLQLLLKEDLNEKTIQNIKMMLKETKEILETVMKHTDHWCKHCVEVHLHDAIARFFQIQRLMRYLLLPTLRYTQSLLHQLDKSRFYLILQKSTGSMTDSINDRSSSSPIKFRSDQKSMKSLQNTPQRSTSQKIYYEEGIHQILLDLRSSGQIYQLYNEKDPLEALRMIIQDLLRENSALQAENKLLNNINNQPKQFEQFRSADFAANSIQKDEEQLKDIRQLFEERERVINELFEKLDY